MASRTRFSGVILPNAVKRITSSGIAVPRSNPLPGIGAWCRCRHAHLDNRNGRARIALANVAGKPFVVDEQLAARLDDDAQHGPEVSQRTQQTDGAELSEAFSRVGMVEPELVPVVVLPRRPLLQQHPPARVVQLPVVQDGETGIPDEIGPHVVVAGGVAELIDDEIVWPFAFAPGEIEGAEHAHPGVRGVEVFRPSIDEEIDLMSGSERRQKFPVVLCDAGPVREAAA